MARIAFIQNDWFEYFGIMEISAVLKRNGHECELMLFEGKKHLLKSLLEFKPDLIGFSVMTVQSTFVLSIASLIKSQGMKALIIAGGHHPTLYPDFIYNDCIDIINIGEGEYSMLDLANAIDTRRDYCDIQNLIVKRDGKIYKNTIRPQCNMDDLPLPDRELYFKYNFFRKYGIYSYVLTRGCTSKCNYCFNHAWNKLYSTTENFHCVRNRSVDKYLEDIDRLRKRVHVAYLSFNDSTFNENQEWAVEFMHKYRQRFTIPFSLNLRPGHLSEEFAEALALTKCCYLVRIGIEVGDEKYRQTILRKNITNKQIYETVDLLKKYKIRICTYNMFALPGETVDQALMTIEMNQKIKPYVALTSIFHPFPGIDLTIKSIDENILNLSDMIDTKIQKMATLETSIIQPEIKSTHYSPLVRVWKTSQKTIL